MTKSSIGWLTGTKKHPYYDFVEVGDLIKVDGENQFRTVLSTPNTSVKADYRDNDNLSYFGKISSSNYDGISRGEGLDIVAEIENGRVSALLWNKIEWGEYVTQRILPTPPGYGYETAPQLVFVSQPQKDAGGSIIAPAQGGGAKAYAVVNNGEIIDVVLYDQGSDYITEPRVYVTRNYEILRKGRNIETSLVTLDMSPQILDARTLFISSGDVVGNPQPPLLSISSLVVVTPLDAYRKITAILQREVDVTSSDQRVIQHITEINLGINASIISTTVDVHTSSIATPAGAVGIGSQNNVTITQTLRELKTDIRTFAKANYILAYKSLNATGAYLDSAMSLSDVIAYVTNTEKFKPFGKLLIGDEIVTYTLKMSDRFLNIERGIDGTTIKEHPAGQFLRQYGDDVSIISAGVESGDSIVTIQIGNVGVTTSSVGITDIIQIEVDNTNILVEKEVTDIIQITTTSDSIISTSVSNTTILSVGLNVTITENNVTKQIERVTSTGVNTISTNTIQRVVYSLESFYKTGFIDYYTESVLFTNPVRQRDGSVVVLDDPANEVIQRSGSAILINNAERNDEALESYQLATLGNRLGLLNNWYSLDTGTTGSTGLTFNEIETFYDTFTIRDFEERAQSSIGYGRDTWKLTYPSIQNPVTISATNGSINSTISVQNTSYFANSGYIYHTNGTQFGVIRYTGKTATTFTGCTVYSGSTSIYTGSQIIPYSV